jgi:hypothetical protein
MLTRRALGRVTAVVAVAAAVQLAPLAAYADTPIPVGVVDTGGLGTVTGQVSTCRLDSHNLFDSPLAATVEKKTGGEIDYLWHAASHASVSSADPCVTGIMLETQLTDSTSVPNCPPVVQSPVVRAVSEEPFTYASNGASDYEVDNPVDFEVAYFGGPAASAPAASTLTTSDASGSAIDTAALGCDRVRSTVTESDTAYYENNLRQFVPFCSQQISTEFVGTPAGPEQVGDPIVVSTDC